MKKNLIALMACLLFISLAACGEQAASAGEILEQAAGTMAEAESLQFVIERNGDPVPLEGQINAAMISATGAYQAPDSVHATVRVDVQGLITDAEVLWQGESMYFKLPPLFPSFNEIELTFDATDIFDEEAGLPSILRELNDPTLVGEEDIEGVGSYHIRAEADGDELSNLVGGAVESGPATIDLWVDRETNEVVRVKITEASDEGWLIDFFAFGEPVEIPTP